MPTYTQVVGGKTYTFDSEHELTPAEQKQEATIFYMEDKAPERQHLAEVSKNPSKDEQDWAKQGNSSMWQGLEGGAEDFGYGVLNSAAHPWEAVKGMVKAQVGQAQEAADARHRGDYGQMLAHDAAAAIPIVGPFAAQVGKEWGNASHNPEQAGRAAFDSSLLFGPELAKTGLQNAGNIAEFGRSVAKDYPGAVNAARGAAEGYAVHGGHGAAIGGLLGYAGVPTTLGGLIKAAKDVMKPGAEAAADEAPAAAGEAPKAASPRPVPTPKPVPPHPNMSTAVEEAMQPGVQRSEPLNPKPKPFSSAKSMPEETEFDRQMTRKLDEQAGGEHMPTPGNGQSKVQPKPVKQTKANAPDFLRQDVAGYKPGAKFNPADKSLSIPGKGTQSTKLLRADESVMGLMRELGFGVPEGGFSEYPVPPGTTPAAVALRQRASISGQRTRTRR